MPGIGTINLKVALMDTDFYARQSINSYLAWDRRTRVVMVADSMEQLSSRLAEMPTSEFPNVFLLDLEELYREHTVIATIQDLRQQYPDSMIVCLSQFVTLDLADDVVEAGADAFFIKHELKHRIAWAICYTLEKEFVVTREVAEIGRKSAKQRLYHAKRLPPQREYTEMTDRVRQAIQLCVIEGMPAQLAADEMGISLHTIRGYIRDGYRIMEDHDDTVYPPDLTAQELAFMRFTALAEDLNS